MPSHLPQDTGASLAKSAGIVIEAIGGSRRIGHLDMKHAEIFLCVEAAPDADWLVTTTPR